MLVLVAGIFAFFASSCPAEELKKLQAPVKGSLAINPVTKQSAPVQSTAPETISPATHTAVQVPTISGPTYQQHVADIFKGAEKPIPTGSGDTGTMDGGIRRTMAWGNANTGPSWLTKTAEAKLPGSDSTLPRLGGGSIDQSDIVTQGKAATIPGGRTIPVDDDIFDGITSGHSAGSVDIVPDIVPGGVIAKMPAAKEIKAARSPLMEPEWVTKTAEAKLPGSDSTLPKLGGGSIDQSEIVIKSEAPAIPDEDTILPGGPLLAASAPVDTSEDTITPAGGVVARTPTGSETPTAGDGLGPRKRAAAQRLLADSATTEPRAISVPEESSAGEEPTASGGTGLGSRKRAAAQRLLADSATTEPRTITVPESSSSGGEAPAEDEGSPGSESKGDSLEDRVMSRLEELHEEKQEAVQGKDTTKNGDSKNAESS